MPNIVLVRHGQTKWSLEGKHTGRTDIPLTEEGKRQAKAMAPFLQTLNIKKAFVSPLERAQTTFALSTEGMQSTLSEDLLEWNYGKYEGITLEQIHETQPGWSLFTDGAPGGESLEEIEKRAKRALLPALSSSETVALFSSGHILRSIVCSFLGLPITKGAHFVLSTASVSILGYEHEKPALYLWNQTFP